MFIYLFENCLIGGKHFSVLLKLYFENENCKNIFVFLQCFVILLVYFVKEEGKNTYLNIFAYLLDYSKKITLFINAFVVKFISTLKKLSKR